MTTRFRDLFWRRKAKKSTQEYLLRFEEIIRRFEVTADKAALLRNLIKTLDLDQVNISVGSDETVSIFQKVIETQIGRKLRVGERVKLEAMVNASKSKYVGKMLSPGDEKSVEIRRVVRKQVKRRRKN